MAPRTVAFLRSLGHDVLRVSEVLPVTATDREVIGRAIAEGRTVLTQDLDFSAAIALTGNTVPSLISLRRSSSRVEYVTADLDRLLAAKVSSDDLQALIAEARALLDSLQRRP